MHLSPTMLVVVGGAVTVLGTVGGVLEKVCKPGTFWYKAGVLLGSLLADFASLTKLGGAK